MRTEKSKWFTPVDKQAWIDQAKKDLKGEDFEKGLITPTKEGFPLFPFYTAEDSQALGWVKSYENQVHPPSINPGLPPRVWANVVEISGGDEKMVNREIRFVLDNGADGLIMEISGKEDLDVIFNGVLPEYIQLWIKPVSAPGKCLKAFFEWVSSQAVDNDRINGGLLWDSFTLDHQDKLEDQLEEILMVHELSKPFPGFKSICVDTSLYHNAGATAVQETGYGLAALVELIDGLTKRGVKAKAIFQDMFLKSAVGSHYFMEIAKLKTFRIAFHQLADLYQVAISPEDIHLFATSSPWNKATMEPENNLVRNTSEAMAAIIGGCNTLFIEPHDKGFKNPDDFSKRMARNISIILREESYFDIILDPAAGSYYVENLVHSIQEHAVRLLQTVEKNGGWYKLYLDNKIQEEIIKIRQK